ncbi:hypothetical protein T265_12046 [Opisthorchis viverrini]|uniref:Uncharacterized protein n=1 Tax=Opisthorchis viverrini TaxID=6198 RepID=A0A074Z0M8_OPIVI|nr:hypothetical protein T265_12046 [Opisthorchis viverrini]KER19027.1 hypothetical protein T265_12046 [Opisthorchis viverrini]
MAGRTDPTFPAGKYNVQLGGNDKRESHFSRQLGVDTPRTDNDYRFLGLCIDHHLFIANINMIALPAFSKLQSVE